MTETIPHNPATFNELMPLVPEGESYVPVHLEPHQSEFVQTGATLYDPLQVEDFVGFKATVPLILEAADKRLMVVDIRSYPQGDDGYRRVEGKSGVEDFKADYLLICPDDYNVKDSSKGFLGIRNGEPLVFGRGNEKVKSRFDISSGEVSREHFKIQTDAAGMGLLIEDLGSTNGTKITVPDHTMHTNRTMRASEMLAASQMLEDGTDAAPNGFYDGDPILGRKSPRISGGVYVGTGREAITVKPDKDPRISAVYDRLFKKQGLRRFLSTMAKREGQNPITDQLESVYSIVQSTMAYDGPAVDELSAEYAGNKKVSLGEYIEKGVGVCRHQGLLAAYLVERLIDDGKLKGQVKIERNTIPEYGGTHAWATYVSPEGVEYVIDAAQDFVGTKQQARQKSQSWDYYLPLS